MTSPKTLQTPSTDLVVSEPPPDAPERSMLAVIERAARDKDVDVDKMERLLNMQERIYNKLAEVKFNEAMRAAQAEMPAVHRDAVNPSTNSRFSRLETVQSVIDPIYTKHGFSLSYGTGDTPLADHYRVTCIVSHSGGHSREYHADLPIDYLGLKGNPSKTRTHAFGSSLSYGRRYLKLLIFDVRIIGADDDASGAGRKQPQGPSTMQPSDLSLKELAQTLWDLLKPVRGDKHNWDEANQWLWREEFLDGAVPEVSPNLSAAKFKEVIDKVKKYFANNK